MPRREKHSPPAARQSQKLKDSTAGVARLAVHTNKAEWPLDLVETLGQVPDHVLATQVGLSTSTVTNERKRRRIAPSAPRRPPIQWTEEWLGLLGTASDRDIAKILGFSSSSVERKRRLLRIPSYAPPPHLKNGRLWRPSNVALLGKYSDRDVARQIGASATAVQRKRMLLGIAPCNEAPTPINWSRSMLKLLGNTPDADIASQFGIDGESIRRKRDELKIPAHTNRSMPVAPSDTLLGILRAPISEAIRASKLTKKTIYKLRHKYGIKVADPRKARWTPTMLARLGVWPDRKLATSIGLTVNAVASMRRSRGIPPVTRQLRPWTKAEIALLRRASDVVVASRIKRSRMAVAHKRRALGIPQPA